METVEEKQRNGVFYAVSAEMLQPGQLVESREMEQ
jgi:hypothetical protein